MFWFVYQIPTIKSGFGSTSITSEVNQKSSEGMEIVTVKANLAQLDLQEKFLHKKKHEDRLLKIETQLKELIKEKEEILNQEVENFILIKIPLKHIKAKQNIDNITKIQIGTHRIRRDTRGKRFVTEAIAGISAFVVESGLWSVFKVACSSFLEFTGEVILDEIISLFTQTNNNNNHDSSRYGPDTHLWKRETGRSFDKTDAELRFLFDETNKLPIQDLDTSEFLNGCDSIVNCLSEDNKARLEAFEHNSAMASQICMWDNSTHASLPMKIIPDKVKYFDKDLKRIKTPLTKVGQAKYKGYCYFDELMCLIPYEHYIDTRYPNVVGCGGCAAVEMRINWIEVNISEKGHQLLCQSLTDNVRQWKTWDKITDLNYVQEKFPKHSIRFVTSFKMLNIDYIAA